MLTLLDGLSLFMDSLAGVVGLILNTLFIYLLLFRTKKDLHSYSVVLMNGCITDSIASFCVLYTASRQIPVTKTSGLGVYLGPCSLVSGWSCSIAFIIWMHCFANLFAVLVIAFGYRFYILNHATLIASFFIHDGYEDRRRELIDTVIVATRPDLLEPSIYIGGKSEKTTYVGRLSLIYVFGLGFLSMCICQVSNIIIQRRLQGLIASESTKRMNGQLIRALNMQHLVEVCLIASLTLFFVTYGKPFLQSRLFEHFAFILAAIAPACNPAINMYCITYYRKDEFKSTGTVFDHTIMRRCVLFLLAASAVAAAATTTTTTKPGKPSTEPPKPTTTVKPSRTTTTAKPGRTTTTAKASKTTTTLKSVKTTTTVKGSKPSTTTKSPLPAMCKGLARSEMNTVLALHNNLRSQISSGKFVAKGTTMPASAKPIPKIKKVGPRGPKVASRLVDLLISEESRVTNALPTFYLNPSYRIGRPSCPHTKKRNELIRRAMLNVNNLTGIRYLDYFSNMTWDCGLERAAAKVAAGCKAGPSKNPRIGQNSYFFNGTTVLPSTDDQIAKAVGIWAGEFAKFGWPSIKYTAAVAKLGVSDATQMAWATTTKVGCGVALCNSKKSALVVCKYKKAGNKLNQNVYTPKPKSG